MSIFVLRFCGEIIIEIYSRVRRGGGPELQPFDCEQNGTEPRVTRIDVFETTYTPPARARAFSMAIVDRAAGRRIVFQIRFSIIYWLWTRRVCVLLRVCTCACHRLYYDDSLLSNHLARSRAGAHARRSINAAAVLTKWGGGQLRHTVRLEPNGTQQTHTHTHRTWYISSRPHRPTKRTASN